MRLMVALSGLAAVGTACASGKSEKKEEPAAKEQSVAGNNGDEDSVDLALPMGLLGELDAALNTSRLNQEPTGFTRDPVTLETHFELARDLLSAPERLVANTLQITAEVEKVLASALGASGLLTKKVAVSKAGEPLTLRLKPETAPTFENRLPDLLQVRATPGGELAYELSVLTRDQEPGYLAVATTLAFSPGVDGGPGRLRMRHAQAALGDAAARDFVTLTYDGSVRALDLQSGRTPVTPEVPAGTLLKLTRDQQGGTSLSGAYAWAAQPAATQGIKPRYSERVDGDVELFRLRRSSDAGPSAQELAFVPAGATGAPSAVFTDSAYDGYASDYVTKLLRSPGINNVCATTGKTLRDAITGAGAAVPAPVAALPEDVCLANSGLEDAGLWAAIDATCRTIEDVVIQGVSMVAADGTVEKKDLSICEHWGIAMQLVNPQYFNPIAGGKELVQPPATPTAAHEALRQTLLADAPLDPAAARAVVPPPASRVVEADVMATAKDP